MSSGALSLSKAVHYTYNTSGQRMVKFVDGTQTESDVYDGENLALAFDGSGAWQHRYLWGPGSDQILGEDVPSGQIRWFITDEQGSVCEVSTNWSTSLARFRYDSFGNAKVEALPGNAAPVDVLSRYTGQVWDPDLGLSYFKARWYDAGTGRFISQDPSGFSAGDSNFYRYVKNNPISYSDPSRLCGQSNTSVFGSGTTILASSGRYLSMQDVFATGPVSSVGQVGSVGPVNGLFAFGSGSGEPDEVYQALVQEAGSGRISTDALFPALPAENPSVGLVGGSAPGWVMGMRIPGTTPIVSGAVMLQPSTPSNGGGYRTAVGLALLGGGALGYAALNGNSLAYGGPTHVYAITDSNYDVADPWHVYKFGKGSQLTSTGESVRALSLIRPMNAAAGYERYSYEVIDNLNGTRSALDLERQLTQQFTDVNGSMPVGMARPACVPSGAAPAEGFDTWYAKLIANSAAKLENGGLYSRFAGQYERVQSELALIKAVQAGRGIAAGASLAELPGLSTTLVGDARATMATLSIFDEHMLPAAQQAAMMSESVISLPAAGGTGAATADAAATAGKLARLSRIASRASAALGAATILERYTLGTAANAKEEKEGYWQQLKTDLSDDWARAKFLFKSLFVDQTLPFQRDGGGA